MSFDKDINNIDSNRVNSKYGDVKNQSANALYENYCTWMKEKQPGAKILSFKEWIKWAKTKGLIKNHNAAGDDAEAVTKVVKSTGKTVAWIMILVSGTILGLSFVKFNNGQQQPLTV